MYALLHGAGGAGTDNRAQISGDQISGTRIWTKPENQGKYPTFVLVPQSPVNWVDRVDELSPETSLVLEILGSVKARFNVDCSNLRGRSVQRRLRNMEYHHAAPRCFRGRDSLVRRRRSTDGIFPLVIILAGRKQERLTSWQKLPESIRDFAFCRI